MSKSMAKQIKEKIELEYRYNGRYCPPKADDIIEHLKANYVDHNEPSPHNHSGFDESFDGSLIIFYYADNSVLVVSSAGINAPY